MRDDVLDFHIGMAERQRHGLALADGVEGLDEPPFASSRNQVDRIGDTSAKLEI